MPNGRAGDHPLTDIIIHDKDVYSEKANRLIKEIYQLGGRKDLQELDLLGNYDDHNISEEETRDLEQVLKKLKQKLKDRNKPRS